MTLGESLRINRGGVYGGAGQEAATELKQFFELLATRKLKLRQFYRSGYFTDGRTVIWEYPHDTSNGKQMDFVEAIEIENGLIQKHRAYWRWFGFNVIKNDECRR